MKSKILPKHKRTDDDNENSTQLIPGLPNHLAQQCLTNVNNPFLLSAVCRRWRSLVYSPSFPDPFLSIYAIVNSDSSVEILSLNPNSSTWLSLPPPPSKLHLLLRHPEYISRNLPIQAITVSGHLVLIAATTNNLLPALSCPLVFNPISNEWSYGPEFGAPRRWCATGSVGRAVYVASGVGLHYDGDVARSVEKWEINEKTWEKMAGLKDGRFSREAVEGVGYKGKIYMVNVKGNAAKQGGVYDVVAERWGEMPVGMLAGWNGPVAVDDERVMYLVDGEKGVLKRYDEVSDCWLSVVECLEYFKGAEQMDVSRGRVCVVCRNGGGVAVVDVAAAPVKIQIVSPPEGKEVVAVHILPRMSHRDDHEEEEEWS